MSREEDFSEKLKLKKLLYDSITGLPTLHALLPDFVKELELDGSIGFILINFHNTYEIENRVEYSVFDEFLIHISDALQEFRNEYLTNADRIFIKNILSTDFIISISACKLKDGERIKSEYIKEIVLKLQKYLSEDLRSSKFKNLLSENEIAVGYSRLVNNPILKMERQIHYAIKQAKVETSYKNPEFTLKRRKNLSNIINNKLVDTHYQPIVHLSTNEIVGYEALNRPKKGTGFELAETLYLWANMLMLDLQLDILCIEQSFDNLRETFTDEKYLFINTFPKSIENSTLTLHQLVRKSRELNIPPQNIVLEMTERTAIEDMNIFKRSIEEYKSEGFKIAIDDVGAGYSSLSTIAHLEPDFLKFDTTLVRNLHIEPIKQQLLRTVVEMADRLKSTVIAEGIELEEEYKILKEYDIKLGQGYYFGEDFNLKY